MTPRARALPWTVPAAGAGVFVALLWCALALILAVVVGVAAFPMGPASDGGRELRDPPSAFARRDIPPEYLRLYVHAAHAYGLDWATLAAIGKVECDHGRDPDPSCKTAGATNSAGAGGPMQFLAPTWSVYGRDANRDGTASRWDPADAIVSAAAYLAASGAPRDTPGAIFAYNHARSYVVDVERWAARYSARASEPRETDFRETDSRETDSRETPAAALGDRTTTAIEFVEGEHARLAPARGHPALIPLAVPAAVQAMVIAGNELQGLPYGPAGHPDPLGASQEDCSSTVNFVLYRAGVRPLGEILRTNPLAQDYVGWGARGPGRWVTIYATAAPVAHVFIVIAGLRLDTSHAGTDVGPNRLEGGPRWRLFDRIPAWARWSARHPPGL